MSLGVSTNLGREPWLPLMTQNCSRIEKTYPLVAKDVSVLFKDTRPGALKPATSDLFLRSFEEEIQRGSQLHPVPRRQLPRLPILVQAASQLAAGRQLRDSLDAHFHGQFPCYQRPQILRYMRIFHATANVVPPPHFLWTNPRTNNWLGRGKKLKLHPNLSNLTTWNPKNEYDIVWTCDKCATVNDGIINVQDISDSNFVLSNIARSKDHSFNLSHNPSKFQEYEWSLQQVVSPKQEHRFQNAILEVVILKRFESKH